MFRAIHYLIWIVLRLAGSPVGVLFGILLSYAYGTAANSSDVIIEGVICTLVGGALARYVAIRIRPRPQLAPLVLPKEKPMPQPSMVRIAVRQAPASASPTLKDMIARLPVQLQALMTRPWHPRLPPR